MVYASRMMKHVLTLACVAALAGCSESGTPLRPGGAASPSPNQPAADPARAMSPQAQAISASKLREEAIQRIEELAASDDPQVRANAVEAATLAPARLRGVIERGLRDDVPAIRMIAAMGVGRAMIRDLVPRVRPLIHDGQIQVRGAAIYALAKHGVDVDQSQLATMLLSDASPWESRQAAFLLGEIGNRTAVALLQSALRDRVPTMPPGQQRAFQVQIAEALTKLGDDSQRSTLRAALFPSQVEDLETTALAAQALGDLGDTQSAVQFMNMLAYRDRAGQPYPAEVRLAIAAALGKLTRSGAPEAERATRMTQAVGDEFYQHADPNLRAQAAFVFGARRGDRGVALDRLATLLRDPQPRVRVAAAAGALRATQ